jgi:hypothetical protein
MRHQPSGASIAPERPPVVVGNDATGHLDGAWKGDASLVQFWSRALSSNLAIEVTAGNQRGERSEVSLPHVRSLVIFPSKIGKKFFPT